MNKQVVKYSALLGTIKVGFGTVVVPVDHPDTYRVTNGEPARTSPVQSYDEVTGQFETRNTLYVPA
jgi:hypothetical protein